MQRLRRRGRVPEGRLGAVVHRKTVDSLVVLDNPDDGEIYSSGDAADMAIEGRAGKGAAYDDDGAEDE